jgi:protein arginine N-methyltransferase 1
MAGDNMDIEVAEKQLKSLDHSEQHYFNSYNHHGERNHLG